MLAWTAAADTSDPVELLQIKLHQTAKAAGLGDMAVDIWKTLRIWMDRSDVGDPQGPDLALVTTSIASSGTAAYALRPSTRDVALATQRLLKAAEDSTNEDTQDTRGLFLALDPVVRTNLLNRARILDGQMPPEDLDQAIREALLYALPTGGPAAEDRFVAQV